MSCNTNQNTIIQDQKQVILLMITDNNKWHYLALKSIRNEQGFVKPTQSVSRLF